MCDPAQLSKPEWRLSALIERETGISIDKHVLRMFIRAHWSEVAGLAHAIHGKPRVRAGSTQEAEGE